MSFKERAKQRTSGSEILQGREKITTRELIAKYPGGIHITDFDFLHGKNGDYVVCTFSQDPTRYFNGGSILTDIFTDFMDDYKGDLAETRKAFSEEGGIVIKLSEQRSRAGNIYTKVDVLD